MLFPPVPLITRDVPTDIDLIVKYLHELSTSEGGGTGTVGPAGPQGPQGPVGPSGVTGLTTVKKTLDQSISVSTDINELSFNVVAGHTYHFKFAVVAHSNSGVSNVGFQVTYPAALVIASKGTT